MEKIYNNFDNIEVTFKCAAHADILEQLSNAKKKAVNTQKPHYTDIGEAGLPVKIENVKNGDYDYHITVQESGDVFMVKDSHSPYRYNIKAIIHSRELAHFGYEHAKLRINEFLEHIGAYTGDEFSPEETISCVHYCFDFAMDDFTIKEECIIAPSKIKILPYKSAGDITKIESLYIGRNKQKRIVFIYDKIKEITEKHNKDYWFPIYGIRKGHNQSRIWRVEFRYGRDELKMWSVKTFKDLEAKLGDIIRDHATTVRFYDPTDGNKHRSRRKNADFWESIHETLNGDLAQFSSGARRDDYLECHRSKKQKDIKDCILNQMPMLLASHGLGYHDLADGLDIVEKHIADAFRDEPEKFMKKIEQAGKKCKFVD